MTHSCSFRLAPILTGAFISFFIVAIPAHAQNQSSPPPSDTTTTGATDNTGLHRSSSDCLSKDYKPDGTVTNSEHFRRFTAAVFSWQTIAGPAVSTSLSQWLTSHKGYGSDPNAWAYHFGINLAGNVTRKFLGRFVGPAIFHQDDAYQPLGPGHSTSSRMGHIFHHLIVTDSADHTHRVFNVSAIPASVVNTGFQNLYEPHEQRTVEHNLTSIALDLAVFSAGDAYAEYRCALKKLLPGHHHDDSSAPASR
jgi:hypothetical protein